MRPHRSARSSARYEASCPASMCWWSTTDPPTRPHSSRARPARSWPGCRSTWASAARCAWATVTRSSAGYDVAVQIDADGQHDPRYVPKLIDGLQDASLVIGARFAGEGDYQVHGPRRWSMAMLSLVLSALAGSKLTDTTSGFRACDRALIELFAGWYPVEYLGDTVETVVRVLRLGYKVMQVPVAMRQRFAGAPSQVAGQGDGLSRPGPFLRCSWPSAADEAHRQSPGPASVRDASRRGRPGRARDRLLRPAGAGRTRSEHYWHGGHVGAVVDRILARPWPVLSSGAGTHPAGRSARGELGAGIGPVVRRATVLAGAIFARHAHPAGGGGPAAGRQALRRRSSAMVGGAGGCFRWRWRSSR